MSAQTMLNLRTAVGAYGSAAGQHRFTEMALHLRPIMEMAGLFSRRFPTIRSLPHVRDEALRFVRRLVGAEPNCPLADLRRDALNYYAVIKAANAESDSPITEVANRAYQYAADATLHAYFFLERREPPSDISRVVVLAERRKRHA